VKKMLELNAKSRPDMKFLQMDATAMTFPDESFSVSLDKGTLDALFADDEPETRAVVENYFKEILRTMRWVMCTVPDRRYSMSLFMHQERWSLCGYLPAARAHPQFPTGLPAQAQLHAEDCSLLGGGTGQQREECR